MRLSKPRNFVLLKVLRRCLAPSRLNEHFKFKLLLMKLAHRRR